MKTQQQIETQLTAMRRQQDEEIEHAGQEIGSIHVRDGYIAALNWVLQNAEMKRPSHEEYIRNILVQMHDANVAAYEDDNLSEEDTSDFDEIQTLIGSIASRHNLKVVS